MITEDLKGKRLLLIGGIGPTSDLVELAHRNGVFLGVTDYNKDTYVKRIADAAYEINALDEDAVVDLYKTEKYDGVISNFNDMLLPYVTRIALRVGAFVPYTDEQLRMSTDKKFFKKTCAKYGVPVPKEYIISDAADIKDAGIEYPVITKPVDGSGSKGISVCYSREDMIIGIDKAKRVSRSNDIIVEDYLPFDEINITYIAQNGDIQLAAIHDRYFNTSQKEVIRVPDMYIYPSRYTDMYILKYNTTVINMLKGIGIENGSLFLQAVVRENEVYFYEAGMRLNGCKTYQILEVENDYNTFEHLMYFALTGSMGKHYNFNAKMKRWYATWNVVGVPGTTCGKFIGQEALESYPWLIKVSRAYVEGDKIPESSKGTLIQLVARIHVCGDTKEQLIERIDRMQTMYQVKDSKGKDALMIPHDIKDLSKHLNYELK